MPFSIGEKQHKVKFVSTERIVYSKKHDYIGKMDAEAMVDGKRVLVDFKTSSGLYNSVRMQTAAYQKADEEEGAKSYKGRWAIRISRKTKRNTSRGWLRKARLTSLPMPPSRPNFSMQRAWKTTTKPFWHAGHYSPGTNALIFISTNSHGKEICRMEAIQ